MSGRDAPTGPGADREEDPLKLELRGVTKRFGSLVANDHIDLVAEQGEIHGLLGENGAGKTTLMNILYGLIRPDEGEILLDGTLQHFRDPRDAIAAGVGMVHQHFMLVPVFTVAENVMLGRERVRRFGFLDRARARRDVRELSERYGLQVPPDAVVEDLPVGVQQRVEIVKALLREARVLILDEPTAVLTPQETGELFAVLRTLKESGRSVVFISHKLKEVREIADKVTVIRRGRVVDTVTPDATEAELASLMVGRPVMLQVQKAPAKPQAPVLEIEHLTVQDQWGAKAVDDVSFEVRGGEILAVAGVQGNGQTELVEAVVGLLTPTAGSIRVDGKDMTGKSPQEMLAAGVGYVPEDRQRDGLVGQFSVAENLVLDIFRREPFARGIALSPRKVNESAEQRRAEFDIRTPSVTLPASALSGGNQQKVVLARELSRPLRLFIAAQPTRGVDVGSTEFLHNRIVEERDRGTAVIIVSTELDEVLSLADRIAVMYRGRITGIVPPDTSREDIGLMMAGSDADAGRAQKAG